MIEDFDGPDPAPAYRVHMRVVSIVLIAASVGGYAAASSPALRGPFATPDPNPVALEAVSPKASLATDPQFLPAFCLAITHVTVTPAFVGGRSISVASASAAPPLVVTTTVYSPDRKTVLWQMCVPDEARISLDRFAR